MREAMSALAREVIASHEARATGLASIRRDVSAHRERTQRHVQELKGTRRVASRALHSHLARGRADLKAGVGAQLRELDQAHNAMAQQQREDLARGSAALEKAEGERSSEAQGWLKDVARNQRAAAQQLRKTLSRGRADLARADAQRRPEVLSWLGELTADRLAAGQEWDHIAAALRRQRGVMAPEAPPAPPVGGVSEVSAALRDRVFAYLADHPDGVRFLEVEQQFKLDSQQASSVLTSLVEDGKAKRAGRLYLAA